MGFEMKRIYGAFVVGLNMFLNKKFSHLTTVRYPDTLVLDTLLLRVLPVTIMIGHFRQKLNTTVTLLKSNPAGTQP